MGDSLASWLSERISDAEKREYEASEDKETYLEDYWAGQVHAFLEVEQFISNQESK